VADPKRPTGTAHLGPGWGYFDDSGFSLNAEWEKQDEHQAININLLFALGYME
jgi:hypothetical protein